MYAIRSLPYTYNRMGGSPEERLRRIAAGVAVELAFRHYLTQQNISFDVKGATPFTEPDRYDVSLGGHRCDIKSFFVTHRRQITEMRRNPGVMLSAPALIPMDQYAAEERGESALYLFAFLAGLVAESQDDLKKALEAGQRHYLIRAMPNLWRRPSGWMPFGALTLKSESDKPLIVEVQGQGEYREFITQRAELPPKTRVVLDDTFFSVSSIHAESQPDARMGIHAPAKRETHLIHPFEWANIWVYGMDIFLAGYIPREEFSRRAKFIPPGSRVFQYNHTKVKNLAVPVSELKPLHELFARVKEWADKEHER